MTPPRRKPADVSAKRIAEADAAGKPRSGGGFTDIMLGLDVLTHLPGGAAAMLDAGERLAAARGVARGVMLAGHGCKASQCFSYAHGEHRDVMYGMLEALGLRDYTRGQAGGSHRK